MFKINLRSFSAFGIFDNPVCRKLLVVQQPEWNLGLHICCTSVPECKISVHFVLWVELQEILRQRCFKWPPNDLESYKAKYTLYMCVTGVWVPNFTLFHSTTNRFRVKTHFETRAPNDPPNDLEHYKGQRYLIYVLLVSLVEYFVPRVSLYSLHLLHSLSNKGHFGLQMSKLGSLTSATQYLHGC